jgi:ribose transport system ATP-binding protein
VTPALSLRGISKEFPGTKALNDVSFDIAAGELHCLLGGNGSGKSTLLKILAGVYSAGSSGEILVHGEPIAADAMTPEIAKERGLRFVHQQGGLFPELSVAENLMLDGALPVRVGRVDGRALRRNAQALIDRFDISAKPGTRMATLRPASQTMVAIARALRDVDAEANAILVLDEPTAALPDAEVEMLLTALRRYAESGRTIVYVTHRLAEVLQVGDEVTVLRDGEVAAQLQRNRFTEENLVAQISDKRDRAAAAHREEDAVARVKGDVVLRVRGLQGGPVRSVDLDIHAGEIVGIAGLLGAGRTSVLEMLFGVQKPTSGEVEFEGRSWSPKDPAAAISGGLAYVPEDRLEKALLPDLSITRNFTAPSVRKYRRLGWVDLRREYRDATAGLGDYAVKARSARDPISVLSGGNQQKVMFGRWLSRSPKLVLLDEPTQGVDVGARVELHSSVRAAAAAGAAVILVSSDFIELAQFSDRVLALRDGKIVAQLSSEGLDGQSIAEALHLSKKDEDK